MTRLCVFPMLQLWNLLFVTQKEICWGTHIPGERRLEHPKIWIHHRDEWRSRYYASRTAKQQEKQTCLRPKTGTEFPQSEDIHKRQQNLKPIDHITLETFMVTFEILNLYIEVGSSFQISLTSSGRTPSRTPSLRKSGSADNLLDQDAHSKVSSQTSSESRPRSGA